MARKKETVVYQGSAGAIDCVIDWPEGEPRGWALVLHPNPQQGGTRDNKVVTTIARAAGEAGLVTVRPNFRGVGQSEGTFDHGRGEFEDMLQVIEQFTQAWPQFTQGPWLLGGFSFGTSVAAQVYTYLEEHNAKRPDAVIFAGPAIQRFQVKETRLPSHTLLIHGETDDVVPLSETMDYAREAQLPVVVIPGAGHFFHGQLLTLRDLVARRLAAL